MRQIRLIQVIALSTVVSFACAARGAAQSPLDPGQLPGRTTFYLLWRGTPAGEIRKNNSLYALWDDPEFATARAAFFASLLNDAQKQKDKPAVSREQLAQYLTLLDNPLLVGYLPRPESPAAAKPPSAKAAPPPAWNGIFFVYDRTGKEELLSKAVLQLRGGETDIPKLTNLTIGGVPALKIERKNGTTYWSEFGKYAVEANEPGVFEEIVNLVGGKPAASPLAESTVFQEAKPLLRGGVFEFFLAIPHGESLGLDTPRTSAAQMRMVLGALKLDPVHSLAGHVSLEGAKTRISGAILGNTTPGGLFDLWADGQARPVSLGYLSPDTIYYGESEFNLMGIYNLFKRSLTPPGASSSQNPLETLAETRLGMPLPDALGLTTGEIAWIQTSPTLDDGEKVYLLGIRNKPNALKLARTLMGDRIASERNEGDTTYLKISLRGGQGSAGVAQWNFYHLAMTPTLLFGSSKSDTLHKYVALAPATSDTPFSRNLLEVRSHYPEKLNGFSFFDFQKVDWLGLQATWATDAKKFAQSAKTSDAAANGKKLTDWLNQVNPEVFPRHLHTVSGASWKDVSGVHFDELLD